MAKIIGIIGGMGPAATIDLLSKIYSNSRAKCDQQHVRVLADIDPTIPDRTQAILNNTGEQIVAHLQRNAQGLVTQGAELLAMPCNTAHAFVTELERAISVPLVSIIDVTVVHLLNLRVNRVGLMATDGTLAARLYTDQLQAKGVEVLLPWPEDQSDVMQAIYAFKGGELRDSTAAAAAVFKRLRTRGAEQVIAACTELPILLAGEKFVDPTLLLARELVRLAG